MKKLRKDFLMLKRILTITFIITLLSNYIMILSEVGNIVFATDIEWQSEFTSNVKNDDLQEISNEVNESTNENNENSNVDENTTSQDQTITEGDSTQENSGENIEITPEYNEIDLENSTNLNTDTEEEQLSQEEIDKIKQVTANTELDVSRFVRFDNENGKGAFVEATLKISIDKKDVDVSNVNTNFELPKLADNFPYKYKIVNSSENLNINEDSTTNNIYINMDKFESNSVQEIKLALVYSKEAFSGNELKVNGNVGIVSSGYEVSGSFEESKTLEEDKGIAASYEISEDTPSKYKGYLYANTMVANKKDVPYTTTNVIKIEDNSFIDEIIIQNNVDKFITTTKEIDLTTLMEYKSTYISVEEFNKMFDEDGCIEIYNQFNEKLGEINKYSEIKNNNYYFYYNTQVDNVVLKVKNMNSNGTLNIKNNKVIKGTDTFSREHIKSLNSIKSETVSKIAKVFGEDEIIVQSIYSENEIKLEETESKMTLNLNTTDFVATEENEVTFEVTLRTDEEKYELFKNPVIYIELPSAVESAEIKNVNLMYKNGLTLSDWKVVQNENGIKVIQIALSGIQEEYMPANVIEGTKVLVTAKINLNKVTANGKSLVKLRYDNEVGTNKSYEKEGNDSIDVEVNYVSRDGVLKETKLQNFNDENEVLVNYEDTTLTGKIDAQDKARTATVSTTIMNNYNEEITDVAIIGKIPTIDNTKNGVNLNTTFNTTLARGVILNGLVGKIYYSTEEDPEISSNSWKENVSDFSQIKSFKVVLENNAMKVGEKVDLSYDLNIPQNVGYNESAYSLITTYYNYNNQEMKDESIVGLESEIKEITLDDCQSVENVNQLSIGTQVSKCGSVLQENEEINEGQILRYTVVLTNNSDKPITNINIKGSAENANSYYLYTFKDISSTTGDEVLTGKWTEDVDGNHLYETEKINSLAAGETKTFSYQVKVKHLDEISVPEVYGKVTISADNIEEKEYNTIKNKVINGKIELSVTRTGSEDINNMNIYSLDLYKISTNVKNISNTDLENVKVNVIIPDYLKYESEETKVYNENVVITEQEISNGKIITFTILKLAKDEEKELILSTTTDKMDLSVLEKEVVVEANSVLENQNYYSNDYIRTVKQSEVPLNITYTANRENESIVKNGDDIKYNITIQNAGVVEKNIDFTDYLPFGLDINNIKLTLPDGSQEALELSEYRFVLTSQTLSPGESLSVTIDSNVNIEEVRSNQTSIVNNFEIEPSEHLSEFEEIIYYIAPEDIAPVPNDGSSDDENTSKDDSSKPENKIFENTQIENKVFENTSIENKVLENENTSIENKSQNTITEENKVPENVNSDKNNNLSNDSITNSENNKSNNVSENTDNNIQKVENINTENDVDSIKYSISGNVWLDKNKNGLYDEDEVLRDVTVYIIKNETNDSIYINDSNIVNTVKTDNAGGYVFNNLTKGNYIVIFEYNNSLYEVTSYKNSNKSKSSDVISKNIEINGTKKEYAVSDIINISDKNISNINAGFKEKSDFDIGITSYIKNVIVENQKGTEKNEFDENDRIVKTEIASKYLNATNITVEFVVKITNNGKTSGYVNQIAEYIPDGFEFDSNLNSSWLKGDDGVLYNSSLSKTILNSGESKEISLILKKAMTENDTGIYKNVSKITAVTNDLQLQDSNDSNDSSEVELILSVKTGAIYYILTIVIALAVAYILTLIVSKFIKNDKKKVRQINKIIIILSVIIIIALCFVIKIYAADYNFGQEGKISLSTFYSRNYRLWQTVSVDGSGTYDYNVVGTLQCIEGSNVSGSKQGNGRQIVSIADINGLDYNTKSIKGNTSGKGKNAVILAILGYDAEKGGNQTTWTYKQLLSTYITTDRSSVNTVLNVNISGASNSNSEATTIINKAKREATSIVASGGGDVAKKDSVTKLEYNSTYNGFGAIYSTFPNDAKLEIYNGSRWVKCSTVIVNGRNVTFNYNNCNDKYFYIPFSAVENYELDKVKVRISAETDVYRARIVAAYEAGSGQNQAVMRGSKDKKDSSVDYTLDPVADVSVEKHVYATDGTHICEKCVGKRYVDKGEEVTFEITVKNKGPQTTLTVEDWFNTSQFECNESGVSNGHYTKTITLAKNTSTSIKLKMTVKENINATANTVLTNNVKISNFKFGNKNVPNKNGNKETDSASIRCKQYALSISKTVYAINDNLVTNQSNIKVEVGDEIEYRINVTNSNGSNDKKVAYGSVKYRVEENVPDGFVVSSNGDFRQDGNKYIYDYTSDSGGATTLKIKMRVTTKLLNTSSLSKTNTAKINSSTIKNRFGVNVIKRDLESSSTVKVLGYNMSVSKVIKTINGRTDDLTKCELGDTIEYTINVKNTGTDGKQGDLYNIILDDLYKTDELEFVSSSANGWTKNNNTQYVYSGPLKPGQTATLTLRLKVILKSKQKVQIANTATVSKTYNKNGVEFCTNNFLIPISSTATAEYQTYDVGMWKYLSGTDSTNVNLKDRISKTNDEKYNSPIEVEKYNWVEYTIKVQNSGTTILNNITFEDIPENGLTFKSVTSAKKYASSGQEQAGESSKIVQSMNGSNVRFNYADTLNAGEYIEVKLRFDVTMSNMYLLNLKNESKIDNLYNRNNIDLVAEDMINYTNCENKEYVRLKNLIISGKVWLDANQDGMSSNGETNLSGIQVILHDDTNQKVATTYTDASGSYRFGETNGTNADGSEADNKMVEGGNNSGRVIKATNRDDKTGNYNSNSSYINYYIEFYYNGAKYTSTVYSGKKNINASDNSIKAEYMIDSNAKEYTDTRDKFNSSLETIEYNTAIEGTHENSNKSNTKDLSYKKNKHESTIETTKSSAMSAYSFVVDGKNYNSGLVNNDNINMLFFSKSGETEYLKYINLGLITRDFDLDIYQDVDNVKTTVNGRDMTYVFNQGKVNNSPYEGAYVTGGENKPLNYQFRWYASDYYYKHNKYQNKKVVEYKENTELNTEITYKMTVTNKNLNDKNKVYAKIREIVDYYSTDFVQYDPTNNKKTIKVLDSNGEYLKDAEIEYVKSWYEFKDSSGKEVEGNVVISNDSEYSEHANVYSDNKYSKLYLTGFDNIKLKAGESFDIYIKFVVRTEDGTNLTNSIKGDKDNIVEINAYSTYLESNDKPAGLVDKNSNPGSLGLRTETNKENGTEGNSIDDYSEFENDAYKTGINTDILERISSENNDTSEKGTLERVIKGTIWDDARSSTVGSGGDTQYVGNGQMNIGSDNKIDKAQSNSKKSNNKLIHDESTDSVAEGINAQLVEIVKMPDNGKEAIYEENALNTWSDAITSTRSGEDGTYRLESFIPGQYIIRFNYGENVEDVEYNGQEYKSTKYYNIDSEISDSLDSGDKVLSKLEEAGKSDARDDEIRRLEVIKYSEIVNNQKTVEYQKQKAEEYTTDFMKNTNMNADTVEFPIRAEKTTYDIKEFSYNEYIESASKNIRYKIENIDFGVEYRPEVNIAIGEFLSEIKLTTTDGNVLVDIKFDNEYEKDSVGNVTGNIIGTTINKENSIGYENLQYLPTVRDVKGLAYLNVDEDLLQGCTVDITYVFSVNNTSEIDRISNSLYNLRYKNDAKGYEAYYDDVYTAAGTARNELYSKYYAKDENGSIYRTSDKISTNGYYGKYLGNTYYDAKIGNNDIISRLKVDMILDYIDNDMTFVATKNTESNKYWKSMTDTELMNQGLLATELFKSVEESVKEHGQVTVKEYKKILDVKGIIFDTDTRHNLVVSVDDKISSGDNENLNKSLSKYLTPYLSNAQESTGNIYMVASKVVSGASDTDNMTYDNSAEIVQYTSSTGRITTLGTAVGNLNMSVTKPDYSEPDSDYTERVTLTPPTGLEKTKYYMSLVKDQLIMIVTVIAVVIVAIVLKKNLKNVTFKKFYK